MIFIYKIFGVWIADVRNPRSLNNTNTTPKMAGEAVLFLIAVFVAAILLFAMVFFVRLAGWIGWMPMY